MLKNDLKLFQVIKKSLKVPAIIDQTGTRIYNAAKVISDYLRRLWKNKVFH